MGKDAEKNLCKHIQKLLNFVFSPTRTTVRILAYNLAKSLAIEKKFNSETHIARKDWLKLFLHRNNKFYKKCRGRLVGHSEELMSKRLIHIFNMDETGLQLNNDPGKVIAAKGSKDVHVIKGQERGETIQVVACCNAEGSFLSPYCIFKGME